MKLEAFERLMAESHNSYLDRLKDLKIKKLGEGAKATVFQHPVYKNVVVKVVRRDAYYMKYVQFVLKNKRNRFVPNIIEVANAPTSDAKNAYLVFMEKLPTATEKFQRSVFKSEFLPHIGTVTWGGRSIVFDNFFELEVDQWRKLAKAPDKDVASISAFIASVGEDHLDMWPSNFGQRGNQLIFSDPVA